MSENENISSAGIPDFDSLIAQSHHNDHDEKNSPYQKKLFGILGGIVFLIISIMGFPLFLGNSGDGKFSEQSLEANLTSNELDTLINSAVDIQVDPITNIISNNDISNDLPVDTNEVNPLSPSLSASSSTSSEDILDTNSSSDMPGKVISNENTSPQTSGDMSGTPPNPENTISLPSADISESSQSGNTSDSTSKEIDPHAQALCRGEEDSVIPIYFPPRVYQCGGYYKLLPPEGIIDGYTLYFAPENQLIDECEGPDKVECQVMVPCEEKNICEEVKVPTQEEYDAIKEKKESEGIDSLSIQNQNSGNTSSHGSSDTSNTKPSSETKNTESSNTLTSDEQEGRSVDNKSTVSQIEEILVTQVSEKNSESQISQGESSNIEGVQKDEGKNTPTINSTDNKEDNPNTEKEENLIPNSSPVDTLQGDVESIKSIDDQSPMAQQYISEGDLDLVGTSSSSTSNDSTEVIIEVNSHVGTTDNTGILGNDQNGSASSLGASIVKTGEVFHNAAPAFTPIIPPDQQQIMDNNTNTQNTGAMAENTLTPPLNTDTGPQEFILFLVMLSFSTVLIIRSRRYFFP